MHWLWDLMESPVTDAASLARRVHLLTAIHLVLPAAALAVLALVAWRIRLLVTLAQRSNVEAALLGFVVVFLLYLLATTAPATKGALTLVGLRVLSPERAQRWLQRYAERDRKETKRAYLNVRVQGPRGGALHVPIADEVGGLGHVRLDGVEVALVEVPQELSQSTLKLIVNTIAAAGRLDGTTSEPRIVAWAGVNQDAAERYAASARAFVRLEQALARGALWPTLEVDGAGVARLADVLREAAPFLRQDMMLPDIEYSAEFSIPIIPEPLAFMQLKRQQEHADAVASLGSATLVVLAILLILGWLIASPPWVPGK